MARKSRKNLPQPEQATVSVQFPELDEEKIPTAIYGRLSVEDDEDKAWNLCAIFDLDNVFTTAVDFCGKNFLRQIRF